MPTKRILLSEEIRTISEMNSQVNVCFPNSEYGNYVEDSSFSFLIGDILIDERATI